MKHALGGKEGNPCVTSDNILMPHIRTGDHKVKHLMLIQREVEKIKS